MPPAEPGWWYGAPADLRARLLGPLATIYGAISVRHIGKHGYRSSLPVICVGNFTAGGTGKTPLSIEIARRLAGQGASPIFLTRGYGGRESGPHWVSATVDDARRVGDEPLLLAREAPTLVSRDRARGARSIEASGIDASVIVMDDGMQNPSLEKDLRLAVVDGGRGLGNGLVIPAGPLRAPLAYQLERTDAIVVNEPAHLGQMAGDGIASWLRRRFEGPVMRVRVVPAGDTGWLMGLRVVAFAGIGVPARFFDLVRSLGGEVVAERPLRDHHFPSEQEARTLIALARQTGAELVTTEKDRARLAVAGNSSTALADLHRSARTLGIGLSFEDGDSERLNGLLRAVLKRSGSNSPPR